MNKIVFFDLDGTIYDGKINEDYIKELYSLVRKKFIDVNIITSRLPREFKEVSYIAKILNPNFICFGDGSILDVKKNKLILLKKENNIIIKKIRNKVIFKNLYNIKGLIYQDKERQSTSRIALKIKRINKKNINYIYKKINIKDWNFAISPLEDYYYIDFFNLNGGKSAQLKKLIEINQYERKNIYYFGDSGQDLLCAEFVDNFFYVNAKLVTLKVNSHIKRLGYIKKIKYNELIQTISKI